MFDPRVMRGATFSMHNRDKLLGSTSQQGTAFPPLPGAAQASGGRQARASEAAAKKKLKWREKSIYDYRAPVGGTGAFDLDLSAHLVEKEQVVDEGVASCQTDAFEPAPAPAPYVPKKTGVDAATHMSLEDQPFSFDRDVQPLLDVVTSKTLEQALLEVEQEAELEAIAKDLATLELERTNERKRVASLEAAARATHGAKEARNRDERARKGREQRLREKVCATAMLKQVWPSVNEAAFTELEDIGVWCDPTVYAVRADFLPWVYEGVAAALDNADASAYVVDRLLEGAFADAARQSAAAAPGGDLLGLGPKGGWVRLFLEATSLGLEEDTVVGPIEVKEGDTIADVEGKIAAWLVQEGLKVALPAEGLLRLALNGKQLESSSRLLDESIGDNAKLEVVLPVGDD
jgi:hypothetical protein